MCRCGAPCLVALTLISPCCDAVCRMLDDVTNDVDEAQERMNFVMGRLSSLLKTKGEYACCESQHALAFSSHASFCIALDKCQLGLILFLVAVLVAMVLLVVYT